MTKTLLQAVTGMVGVVVAAAMIVAPARADVMEIGPEGARWVAGDLAMAAPIGAQPGEEGVVDLDAIVVPDGIVANIATSAAGVPPIYEAKIQELSRRFDLSPSLLEAVVWQESRWRAGAVSHAGARGLAQLMPGTASILALTPMIPCRTLKAGRVTCANSLIGLTAIWKKRWPLTTPAPGASFAQAASPTFRKPKAMLRLSWAA